MIIFSSYKNGACKNTKGEPPTIYFYNVESQKEVYRISGGFSILKYDQATKEVMYLTHDKWADGKIYDAKNPLPNRVKTIRLAKVYSDAVETLEDQEHKKLHSVKLDYV